tara:strand:+ start:3484 stop:5919 length:2436 start_codon:yes stop_codon:yes gene_type:complete
MEKKHLRLMGEMQLSEIGRVKFNYGVPEEEDQINDDDKNYLPIALSLFTNLNTFYSDLNFKYEQRSEDLEVPFNIDYISVTFFDQFNINEYYNKYYNDFGLEGVSFGDFGRSALFGVVSQEKFKVFIANLNAFFSFGIENNKEAVFSNLILYIKEFKLLTRESIIEFSEEELGAITSIDTINLPLDFQIENSLLNALLDFLKENNIDYSINISNNHLELINVSYYQIQTIAANFDIIESITCSLTTIVKPSSFNTTQRAFAFEINNAEEELPIIGVIDTGISMNTPLKDIVLNDSTFTLDGNPLIDEAGRGFPKSGHGTAVAGLAALGRENHLNKFNGTVNADAKLLSIKLSNNGSGFYSEQSILNLLYNVKNKYPEIKIFVLTSCYKSFKPTNSKYDSYTLALDKFSHATDSIIFISTGNNGEAINDNKSYDLSYFDNEKTNLSVPSDSMNNMTVGAAADGLNNGVFVGVSTSKEFPTLFSRKSNVDLKSIYPKNKTNKNLFKPDIIECGGDLGYYNQNTIDYMDNSAMNVLSANPAIGFLKDSGTSLSAPLAANLAAKLLKEYPNLNSQTIKALIINGATLNNIRFSKPVLHLLNKTAGNGFINLEDTLFSNENSATLILEDIISNEGQNIYPINLPKYLTEDNLGRKRGLLKITATLCFSFEPVKNNHLSYCPIHMAFSFFRNHNSDEINTRNKDLNSKLNSTLSWSQNGRYKSKPIPYSNRQKVVLNVNLNQLLEENSTFSIAVQARLTTQLLQSEFDDYAKEYPFSLVIRIEETLSEPTSKLYDELIAINHLEVIAEGEADGTIEV